MEKQILEILAENGRMSTEELAVMLGASETEVAEKIAELEKHKVIFGYKALIDWEQVDKENVSSLIELKVTPQMGEGFDQIANRIITEYPEVNSVSLISGGYDILVELEGKSMKEVALFVARKIAPMDCVLSTATHFVLKSYKKDGVVLTTKPEDERRVISL